MSNGIHAGKSAGDMFPPSNLTAMASLIISVWNPKGGVAKTTTAVNLAATFHVFFPEQSIGIIDADAQGGSMLFQAFAKAKGEVLGFEVVQTQTKHYDIVIYDHQPGLSANVPAANFVLMPITLDAGSLAASLKGAIEIINQGKSMLAIPSRVQERQSDQKEMLASYFGRLNGDPALPPDEAGVATVKNMAMYQRIYARGRTIFHKNAGSTATGAIEDFTAVLAAVQDHAESGRQVSPPLFAERIRKILNGEEAFPTGETYSEETHDLGPDTAIEPARPAAIDREWTGESLTVEALTGKR